MAESGGSEGSEFDVESDEKWDDPIVVFSLPMKLPQDLHLDTFPAPSHGLSLAQLH